MKLVTHLLQQAAILVVERLHGRADIDLGTTLDRPADNVESRHQILEIVEIQNAADAAGDRRRMGDDIVRRCGQVIAAARGNVHQTGHGRQVGSLSECASCHMISLAVTLPPYVLIRITTAHTP